MAEFRRVLTAAVLAAGTLLAVSTVTPAAAVTWRNDDTDNISRAVPSGKAYATEASFTWQRTGHDPLTKFRIVWSLNLHVRNHCGRVQVIVRNQNNVIMKRFPAAGTTSFGFYQACYGGSSGVHYFGGIAETGRDYPASATIKYCWQSGSTVPNGTDCYNFTIHNGD